MKKTHHFILAAIPAAILISAFFKMLGSGMPGQGFWIAAMLFAGIAIALLSVQVYLTSKRLTEKG
ncbi:hypothetical protein ACTHGU_08615 [Chitinophagaceae bacterium MMS25-I14]